MNVVNGLAGVFGLQVSRVKSRQIRLPLEATQADQALITSVLPYTMTSAARLWSLTKSVQYLVEEGIPGDFVECGVWRGGSVMTMALQLQALGVTDRRIWLYDTFSGMTSPTEVDVEASSGIAAVEMLRQTAPADGNNVWASASREDVENNLRATRYPYDKFSLVQGDVAQTLREVVPQSIALLRLDTDWYESTKTSLETLYPRLAIGGVCILDDYGHWEGARKAVAEYFAGLNYRPFMHVIDYSGRVFIKTR